ATNGKTKDAPSIPLAAPDVLDEVYRDLLARPNLRLSDGDKADLARRGFLDGQADGLGYRTMPDRWRQEIALDMAKSIGRDVLLTVPGFFLKGTLNIACLPGLVIPSRNLEGQIVGLVSRPHKVLDAGKRKAKYLWISSKTKGGPGPGAPVHIPLGVAGPLDTVRLTEGQLKADLAFLLSGLPTIGVPGVGNWEPAVAAIKALGAKVVRVAYDADAWGKLTVARALYETIRAIQADGLAVEVERWGAADGKGIDDVLAAGKPTEVLSGEAVETIARELAELAGIVAPPKPIDAELGGWVPPWKAIGRTAWELDNAKRASRTRTPTANPVPEVAEPLRTLTPKAEIDPSQPTVIARSMIADLSAGLVSLHIGPTGSGKSHSVAQAAIERYRNGRATLIAVPTIRLAQETADRIADLAPDLAERGVVEHVFGNNPVHLAIDDQADDDQVDDDQEGYYPIGPETWIIVTTHAQLDRRCFSKYVRAIFSKLGRDDGSGRPAFDLIIDEAAEHLRASRREIPLGHRRKRQSDPEGGRLVPIRDCPKSNMSGHCGQCDLVRHGGSPRFNRYGIRELGHPPVIELDRQGKPLRTPRSPLSVTNQDIGIGPQIPVHSTTFASEVLTWRGEVLDEFRRLIAEIPRFKRDQAGHQPGENADEILGHMLRFAFRPVVTVEHPIDADDQKVEPGDLAKRKAAGGANWDDGITFPRATCDVPRLRFTDLVALEQIRRFAEREKVGVILTGATLGPDDAETFKAVWPELAERIHPYPDRKVRQVALVMPGSYVGGGALIGQDGRLVTAPLEHHGLGLAFAATKRVARSVYEAVCNCHPTARLAVENNLELTTSKGLHHEGPVGTIITYSRGVLGLGANIQDVRHLIADANAFRAIGSFTPGQLTPEEFARSQAAERAALIIQNLGRALRGEAGKTVVLFVLNTDDDLRAALANAAAIIEGSELPPVVVAPERADLPQLVCQAGRWLDAAGGEWPDALPGEATPRKRPGVKPTKTRADVLAAAERAIT
ncbi:MAG: DUF3854 domain-containing protein, partial [Isosphaeraceae bacterium]